MGQIDLIDELIKYDKGFFKQIGDVALNSFFTKPNEENLKTFLE